MLLTANEDEDKVIKKLEKQLGLNKAKNKNNYFADDGLDCILFLHHLDDLDMQLIPYKVQFKYNKNTNISLGHHNSGPV